MEANNLEQTRTSRDASNSLGQHKSSANWSKSGLSTEKVLIAAEANRTQNCIAQEMKSQNSQQSSAICISIGISQNFNNMSISAGESAKVEDTAADELFRPSSDSYTPRLQKAPRYREPKTRRNAHTTSMGTLSRPNFKDALRRVSMIIQQHIAKIERRFDPAKPQADTGLFLARMQDVFHEDNFVTPTYHCTFVRVPTVSNTSVICVKKKHKTLYTSPTEREIYSFGHQLFKTVQLSSECSIVCLIYIERLMEVAKVPLLGTTWRPIFMAGLLLASKVWQDLSSWNIEFASVYPQYSLDAINKLELLFLRNVKWDLYISSSLYAKYYFALRSILEKQDFRNRYNHLVGAGQVDASQAMKIQKRTEMVKEEALMELSKSM